MRCATPPPDAEVVDTVRLAEERLQVETRLTEATARVRVRVHEDAHAVSEPLRRERVEVERVPVDRLVDVPPEPRDEDGVRIVPVVEEVLVRRFRVVEEVRVRVVAETVQHEETVALRRQTVAVEDDTTPPARTADTPG